MTFMAFKPIYKKTFTWIGHHVDQNYAQWCKNLGFTDVVTRYDIDESGSAANLANVGITHWRFSPSWIYAQQPSTIDDYKALLTQEIEVAPTGRIFVDDTFALAAWKGFDALENFAEAVRQTQQNDNITLCFSLMGQSDTDLIAQLGKQLSELNFEVYHPPTMTIDDSSMKVLLSTQAKSIGHVLWAWGWVGKGKTWENMTVRLVRKIYGEAQDYGFSRITVFTGHETDEHEVGMKQASLYNYPYFWNLITIMNSAFKSQSITRFLLFRPLARNRGSGWLSPFSLI